MKKSLLAMAALVGISLTSSARADHLWWWNDYDFHGGYGHGFSWRPSGGVTISFGAYPYYSCRTWDGWSWRYGHFDYGWGGCRYYQPLTRRSAFSRIFGILSSPLNPRWYSSHYYNGYWNGGWRPWEGPYMPFDTTRAGDTSLRNVCRAKVNGQLLPGMVVAGNCEVALGGGVDLISSDWEFPVFEANR